MNTSTTSAHAMNDPFHARYLRKEMLIAIVINSIFSAVFCWLVFGRSESIELWGLNGLAFDFIPQTFIITLMTTIAATLLTRMRVRRGEIAAAPGGSSRLPANVLLRAIMLGVIATVVFGGIGTALLAVTWSGAPSFGWVFTLKILYGALVAAVMSRIALRAALRD